VYGIIVCVSCAPAAVELRTLPRGICRSPCPNTKSATTHRPTSRVNLCTDLFAQRYLQTANQGPIRTTGIRSCSVCCRSGRHWRAVREPKWRTALCIRYLDGNNNPPSLPRACIGKAITLKSATTRTATAKEPVLLWRVLRALRGGSWWRIPKACGARGRRMRWLRPQACRSSAMASIESSAPPRRLCISCATRQCVVLC